MKEDEEQPSAIWWKAPSRQWTLLLQEREEQVFLVLTLLIGALVGAIVVAFILLTERFGARLYPAGGAAWRRLLVPVTGSLGMGYHDAPLLDLLEKTDPLGKITLAINNHLVPSCRFFLDPFPVPQPANVSEVGGN